MSTALPRSMDEADEASHSTVAARSYYVTKPHIHSSSPARLPEVAVCAHRLGSNISSANNNNSSALLSRPPTAQSSHVLAELAEDVFVPVPVRASAAVRVLPVLPCSRGSSMKEGSSNTTALNTAQPMPSADSMFRPFAMTMSTYTPLESEAVATASPAATQETVRPLLCPPMRPARVPPALSTAARTNPFCPEGKPVRHLPSCSPRVLSAPRVPVRQAPLNAIAPTVAAVDDAAAAMWAEAASDADVRAFFGPTSTTTLMEWANTASSPSPAEGSNKRADKELSWPAAETTQSSLCELSISEDMFSIGTIASSEGTAGSAGHRCNVIDLDALASFHRDGARRQRDSFGVATTNTVAH